MAVPAPMRIGVGTELGLQAASRDLGLVLVLAPDRAGGTGVAHRTRLVHGAERQRMVRAAQQAVDLHGRGITRNDADVTNRAAPDTT